MLTFLASCAILILFTLALFGVMEFVAVPLLLWIDHRARAQQDAREDRAIHRQSQRQQRHTAEHPTEKAPFSAEEWS